MKPHYITAFAQQFRRYRPLLSELVVRDLKINTNMRLKVDMDFRE